MIFTADHGEMAGSHGLRQKANLVYDENFHVPLIISHPDVAGGGDAEAMASAVDLAPTLLEIAGVDPAQIADRVPGLHGHSLVPALDGPRRARRRAHRRRVDHHARRRLLAALRRAGVDRADAVRRAAPDWTSAGSSAGYTDERYIVRPLLLAAGAEPTAATSTRCTPTTTSCSTTGSTDPHEMTNLAARPGAPRPRRRLPRQARGAHPDEIGDDTTLGHQAARTPRQPNLRPAGGHDREPRGRLANMITPVGGIKAAAWPTSTMPFGERASLSPPPGSMGCRVRHRSSALPTARS